MARWNSIKLGSLTLEGATIEIVWNNGSFVLNDAGKEIGNFKTLGEAKQAGEGRYKEHFDGLISDLKEMGFSHEGAVAELAKL